MLIFKVLDIHNTMINRYSKYFIVSSIVGLILNFATLSWSNVQFKTPNTLRSSHPPENIRVYQFLKQTLDSNKLVRQSKLLQFKSDYNHSDVSADITLDGSVDKNDLFFYSSSWSQSPNRIPALDALLWQMEDGNWSMTSNGIKGSALHETRLVSLQPVPGPYQAEITISLQYGFSAGFLLWADSSGKTGFVIRYDSALHSLILSRVGPHLEEERLDTFPLSGSTPSAIHLQIQAGANTIRAFLADENDIPVLQAANITPMGNHIGWYLFDASANFQLTSLRQTTVKEPQLFVPEEGEYRRIFDQSVGEDQPWYINDHCFIQNTANQWHLFGTSNTSTPLIPLDEDQFVHATAGQFTQSPWDKHPFALRTDTSLGESQLWAPHVILHEGLFYMFYCAGSQFSSLEYRMHLATSPDLFQWTRHDSNPLFTDFYDARDPMIFRHDGQYIMYYTANSDRPVGNHIVAYRTSNDLINWSSRKTAFTHETIGTFGGPTESPYVVQYQDHYYLFIGPENLNTTPDADYRRTAIYRSSTPFHWNRGDRITSVRSHAAEVIQDNDGAWYVSHCGWFYDGVYLAPLSWNQEPSVQLFVNLGESNDYVTDSFLPRVSDWRNTGGLDLVADYGSFFDLTLPIRAGFEGTVRLEFEEEGEVLLRVRTEEGYTTLLNEENAGPGTPSLRSIDINSNLRVGNNLILRFSDSDPSDGWGANINWIRLIY